MLTGPIFRIKYKTDAGIIRTRAVMGKATAEEAVAEFRRQQADTDTSGNPYIPAGRILSVTAGGSVSSMPAEAKRSLAEFGIAI